MTNVYNSTTSVYRHDNKLLQVFNHHIFNIFKMIRYFLAPNQLITGCSWVAKHAEMTQGFLPLMGNCGCLLPEANLATGDFHQLRGLQQHCFQFSSFCRGESHPSTG